MYIVTTNSVEHHFKTYKELLNYLSRFNQFIGTDFYNTFFENTAGNANDTKRVCVKLMNYENSLLEPRTNRILNDCGANIYSKKLVNDVMNWKYNDAEYKNWYNNEIKKKRKNRVTHRFPVETYPEFRRGPWPRIHKRFRYCYFRNIKTFNEIKNSYNEDNKGLIRGSRGKNLPTSWDEICVDWRNHGWKSQKKCKHQWEHKVIEKTKHEYGNKIYV